MNILLIKNSIEKTLNIDISASSRSRDYIDGRIIFCIISFLDQNTTCNELSALLNKKHTGIVYYKKTGLNLLIYSKSFKVKVESCLAGLGKEEAEIKKILEDDFIKIRIKSKNVKAKLLPFG